MFNTPVPRTSFLDSALRSHSQENRRLATRNSLGGSHLGHGPRLADARTSLRPRFREVPPRHGRDG